MGRGNGECRLERALGAVTGRRTTRRDTAKPWPIRRVSPARKRLDGYCNGKRSHADAPCATGSLPVLGGTAHDELAVRLLQWGTQAAQGHPRRRVRCLAQNEPEPPRWLAHDRHQGLADLRRRMAHAEGHVQQDDGPARHLRHIRRDGQILEKGLVGTAEPMRQRRRQQRRAEAARARQKGVLDRLCQPALAMRRFIPVRLSRLAQGREVAFVPRERGQRRQEGPRLFMRGQGILL